MESFFMNNLLTALCVFILSSTASINATIDVLVSEDVFDSVIEDALKTDPFHVTVIESNGNNKERHYRLYKDGFYYHTYITRQARKTFNTSKVTVVPYITTHIQ